MPGDIKAAQTELNARVLGKAGIAGTAIGQKGGKPCLKVYVSGGTPSVPKSIGGFPVVVERTGGFRRL